MSMVRAGCRFAFDIVTPVINVGSPLGSIWILAVMTAIVWLSDYSLYRIGWFVAE